MLLPDVRRRPTAAKDEEWRSFGQGIARCVLLARSP
jgi:hypothetical protein